MENHSPEPWTVDVFRIIDANGVVVLISPGSSKADLERIAACVTFLKGVPTDILTSGSAQRRVNWLVRRPDADFIVSPVGEKGGEVAGEKL